MIANYGYRDAEGEFYITIVQDRCAECGGKPCIAACPRSLFVEEEDPYGERVAAIDDRKRNSVRYECVECKPRGASAEPACVKACLLGAVRHSW